MFEILSSEKSDYVLEVGLRIFSTTVKRSFSKFFFVEFHQKYLNPILFCFITKKIVEIQS